MVNHATSRTFHVFFFFYHSQDNICEMVFESFHLWELSVTKSNCPKDYFEDGKLACNSSYVSPIHKFSNTYTSRFVLFCLFSQVRHF